MSHVAERADTTTANLRLLLVEDNPGDARLIRTMLVDATRSELQLQYADRLATGLECIRDGDVDLVLLDLSLPDSHGIETFRKTMLFAPALPVIVLTGVKDDALALQALQEGAQDYLVKGETDGDSLLRAIRYGFERNRIELELRRSEERYRTFFEQSKDCVYIADREGRFVDANESFLHMFGYTLRELEEIDSSVLYVESGQHAALRDALRHEGSVVEYPVDMLTHDGSVLHCYQTSTTRRNAVGAVIGFQGIIRDITERLELEQKLMQAQKMEAVGQLAGGVAHDFNNVLTGVSGYASLLMGQLEEHHKAREDALRILEISERAAHLTGQLLAFSRRQTLQKRVFNLNDQVRSSCKMARRLIPEDIDLRVETATDLGNVLADPGQMDQVVLNLLINGRDAMPDGGQLRVETTNVRISGDTDDDLPAGDYVVLRVSDTGIGMDAVTQRQIFEPFFTTKSVGEGTGLGLATVYGVVTQHGGVVRASSELGAGSTFEVYLPSVTAPSQPAVRRPAIAPDTRGSETLLLVEDDGIVRSVTTRVLEMAGYRLLVADRPRKALAIVEEHGAEIDLLVSDVVMPDMNGPAMYAELARRVPGLRVLYVSGYAEREVLVDKVLRVGAPFLAKPFTPSQLTQKVREVLDSDGCPGAPDAPGNDPGPGATPDEPTH